MYCAKSNSNRPFGVLFVCIDNSRRSLIAEALFRNHGTPGIAAYSAGIQPAAHADPIALSALIMAGLGSEELYPKDWSGFADPARPMIDTVVMIGDSPAQLLPRSFPGNPDYVEWQMPGTGATVQRHRGAWLDIQVLRPRIDGLVETLMETTETGAAYASARGF